MERRETMQYHELDFSAIRTYSAFDRHNLVRIDTLLTKKIQMFVL